MMELILVPTITGMITLAIYKFFELIICRKERLLMIEKMGDNFSPEMMKSPNNLSPMGNLSFSALKFGCLFMGIGLGLLIAFFIHANMTDFVNSLHHKLSSVIYSSCILLFGGLGLLIAFLVELNINKKK